MYTNRAALYSDYNSEATDWFEAHQAAEWEREHTYSTRTEAIAREVIEPITADGSSADDYDISAIADEVIGTYAQGYAPQVEPDDFWYIVSKHAR